MSPAAVARCARAVGLDGFALVDHNSGRNALALRDACATEGMACLFGLEVATAEEVHVLALFDTVAAAAALTERVYAALPRRVNQPEVFGDQPVVNAADEIEELEWRLLGAPCRLTLRETGAAVQALGGLFIAAHVDRPTFSVFSQLGLLTGDEGFDACELSAHADEALWRARVGAYPLVRSSDSHYLHTIGGVWCEADLPAFSVPALRTALRAGAVRLSPPLRSDQGVALP
jgi:PHP family Zn ribbon phosphoesterase